MDTLDLHTITTYQAGVMQASMHRKLQRVCDDILRPFGITKMQWLIIGLVLDTQTEGVRMSDLAAKLGTTMPYITNSINLLESRGILERRGPAQVRSKLIVVRESYLPTCQEIEKTLRAGLRETIYAKIDPEEFLVYMKVMNQLAAIELGGSQK